MVSQNILQLWVLPLYEDLKPITIEENLLSKKLSKNRAKEFTYSRGYMREILSKHLNIHPLKLPLEAEPGKVPRLRNNLGYISLSHCKDALFLGWSNIKFGIDIERKDRIFKPITIIDKYYLEEEKKELLALEEEELRAKTLKYWVIKEAAIKCQNGTISTDLSKWLITNNFMRAYHKSLKIDFRTSYIEYDNWSLGIAYNCINLEIKPIKIK